jgi:hypothetical protein
MFSCATNLAVSAKTAPPGGVVEVAVAVDHIAHRHLEPAAQLTLQPGAKAGIDRVAEDDAVAGDEKDVYQLPLRARYRSPVTGMISRAGPRGCAWTDGSPAASSVATRATSRICNRRP